MFNLGKKSSENSATLWLEELSQRSEIIDVVAEGCRVRWRRWGSGDPLVLIHGGSGNWSHWARNIEHLSEFGSVWIPDMPSFGESDALPVSSDDPLILDNLVHVLSETLDELIGKVEAIAVAGFSFGGLVAGTLAASRQSVRKLALLGTAGHGGPKRKIPELMNWRLSERSAMQQALKHNLGELMLHKKESIDALAMAIHEQASLATRFRSKSLSMDMDLKITLSQFNSPTLMVWGEHDVIAVPDVAAARLMDGHPERKFELIADAGHWVQFEASERVNQLLSAWFLE